MCLKNRQMFMGLDPPASRCEALRAGVQRFTANLFAVIPAQAGMNRLSGLGNIHRAGGIHGHPV